MRNKSVKVQFSIICLHLKLLWLLWIWLKTEHFEFTYKKRKERGRYYQSHLIFPCNVLNPTVASYKECRAQGYWTPYAWQAIIDGGKRGPYGAAPYLSMFKERTCLFPLPLFSLSCYPRSFRWKMVLAWTAASQSSAMHLADLTLVSKRLDVCLFAWASRHVAPPHWATVMMYAAPSSLGLPSAGARWHRRMLSWWLQALPPNALHIKNNM